MRVFVTGATGFIGSVVVEQLIARGHSVLGLVRSDASADKLAARGAVAHRGSLTDLDSLRRGAADVDGVIHTAFDHDFSNFVANCEKDRRVIEAIGDALTGSDRPLVITSGTGMGGGTPGKPATEDVYDAHHPNPRKASEEAGQALLARGVNVSVVRLPQVHDEFKQGLISPLVQVAKQKDVSAYVGDGANRWPACPLQDAAAVYVLALEKQKAGARYHAVAEEGVTSRDIAIALGRGLGLPTKSLSPEEAGIHFGWLAMFTGLDMPASSAITRRELNWRPTGPKLLEDLARMNYAAI